jgi:hypothetical protein
MTTNIVLPYERHQYFHDKMQQYKDAQEEENAVPDAVSLDLDKPREEAEKDDGDKPAGPSSTSVTVTKRPNNKNKGKRKAIKQSTHAIVTTAKSLDDRFDESVKIFYELERNGYLQRDEDREFVEGEFRKFVVDGESTSFQPPAKKGWTVCLYNKGRKTQRHPRLMA